MLPPAAGLSGASRAAALLSGRWRVRRGGPGGSDNGAAVPPRLGVCAALPQQGWGSRDLGASHRVAPLPARGMPGSVVRPGLALRGEPGEGRGRELQLPAAAATQPTCSCEAASLRGARGPAHGGESLGAARQPEPGWGAPPGGCGLQSVAAPPGGSLWSRHCPDPRLPGAAPPAPGTSLGQTAGAGAAGEPGA